uniref:Uncharacterized protein n=1 Tax=Vespula pensylvanica TaxID=30213 RepID=A0A834P2I4_VESPE|nr:hypothetical protein H0235_008131 [Vespula pensylvanica]
MVSTVRKLWTKVALDKTGFSRNSLVDARAAMSVSLIELRITWHKMYFALNGILRKPSDPIKTFNALPLNNIGTSIFPIRLSTSFALNVSIHGCGEHGSSHIRVGWTTGIESINFPWASREEEGGVGSVEEKYHISVRTGWVEGGRRLDGWGRS